MTPERLRDTLRRMPVIAAGPLTLKLADSADAKVLAALAAREREDLSTWLGWVTLESTPEELDALLRKHIDRFVDGEPVTTIPYAIKDAQGTIIGMVNLQPKSLDPLSFELGYWLAREARSHGYAAFVVRALVAALSSLFAGASFVIRTHRDNAAAAAVAVKAGFVVAGPADATILEFKLGGSAPAST